jgi:hypothetical protein
VDLSHGLTRAEEYTVKMGIRLLALTQEEVQLQASLTVPRRECNQPQIWKFESPGWRTSGLS